MRAIFVVLTLLFLVKGKVLVIFDSANDKVEYSEFVTMVKELGEDIEIKEKTDLVELFEYDEPVYSTVLMLSPTFSFKSASISSFVKYVDAGGNLLVSLSGNYTEKYTDLLYSFDMESDVATSKVVDEIHTAKNGEDEMVFSNNVLSNPKVFPTKVNNVLFDGVALYLPESPMTSALLKGTETSTTSLHSTHIFAQKENITLVGALQARNNARVVVSGSTKLFSNKAFVNEYHTQNQKSVLDNKKFTKSVLEWVTQKSGVLVLKSFSWTKIDGVPAVSYDNQIVIGDTLKVQLEVEEKMNNKVTGYDAQDLQVEMKLLFPEASVYLTSQGEGKYEGIIKTPLKFGVYTLLFKYNKPLQTYLEKKVTIPLRTYRSTQRESAYTIKEAYPFFIAVATMIGSFVLFIPLYLIQAKSCKKTEKVE
ncbi:dolichyl-diphosphooligosaccharide--protein glycosyltransferase, putative [Entamoeba invadens IP1]|uniref:Dolichyl-diphosphooligosaccharide--protein glycosyltransferase 48 kDa subunit n=1 Tax=Entamoeba invadens IP1 TaxID=370355 RepID=A0A0A1U7W1_ENTIV|nr:dolichyl-diphosphooligosaccharide--protein glycosyltransferase, putative [Entamoeba invadens IP1]ELP91019.1 dolichyl-diphosphooligosaccharide--protein glycosyltransferase, putative [Entamoeba invadens IP1]|eukprot:XP_004257790.1 dolichyl-diphosphooligosaccharide--protein glycosyltransferase, putative [Entamoeba invadens IP1]